MKPISIDRQNKKTSISRGLNSLNQPGSRLRGKNPPKKSTNTHIVAMFSVFTQSIFYLVKNGLHQCVPENFSVKNDMLF